MPEERKRAIQMLAAAAVGVAVLGLILGTAAPEVRELLVHDRAATGEPAVSYKELRSGRRGPNGQLYEGAFAALRVAGPQVNDPVEQTEEEKVATLERRRARRAYAGAPPTVPHGIQEKAPSACMACHGQGAQIAGLRAPAMSHKEYTMCSQCHAVKREPDTYVAGLGEYPQEHGFEGATEPSHGKRAWEGAPPTIPHPVFMRENCASCHGVHGAQGMRSTHPARQSCQQCHAPASDFDQARPPAMDQWGDD